MRQKGAKGAVQKPQSQVGPKPQVGPPEPVSDPQNPKNHLRTQICHKSVDGLWQPSEANRSAPRKDYPPFQGKTSLSSMRSILKDQKWCIYGIIYHYAPFLLRNPMVTLSEPNYIIPSQAPSPSPFLKKDFSAIQSSNSLAATRRPFEDPNHLALQRLGCHLLIRTIMREIIRGYQYFQSLSRHQTSEFLEQLNWSIQVVINNPVWPWPNWDNSYSTVGIQSHSFNSQDSQNCIDPIQTIQPDDSPSRTSLSVIHIYWPPSNTWGRFPQLINILDLFFILIFF
ncbi:hypothetical protein O181_066756 [Austropuccinia psidii MF-1]|uniref:Uncharacterized protein n=1 Tax=Austropuccinia psidii MF-1 TaxID=1389203 RepID=A0A9Q3ERI9_9BASI|nr:hypothetical protein [Austropuccinia psidii MF-1]